MLRTNLSTRPFYNERVVRLALLLLAVIVLGFTVFNTARVVVLNTTNSDVARRITDAEKRAADLRAEAARVRSQIDRRELQAVAAAAREANLLIDRRTFSWTALFNQFEATLPADVRITMVRPQIQKDASMTVTIGVVSRRVEDLDSFIENLEATGAFRNILSRQEATTEEGLIESTVEGQYIPLVGQPAAARTSAPAPEAPRD